MIFSPGKRAKKPEKIPCNRNGISARAEKQEKRGFDKTLTPGQLTPLLTPFKINGKMKIKKAQDYRWNYLSSSIKI